MTNGEKFKDVFGFGADGSRVIAVNSAWWDCEYQSHKRSNEVKPVVRGKWKHGVCQTCFFDWLEVAPLASVPNYCPNCGADMREKS